ncbi:Restriction endonuclease [Natronorubrum sediminis]|uniref:Restriction endonuclease n=1 Tax=Natronorubrum sediminis TaxID=640943 RepID=A0A1H6FQU1_9EURY|nr:restriction endonuclease [Natronorubrum sediminis]SEH12114.1 Restriction endonuclease [Natronorubrum sediminis]
MKRLLRYVFYREFYRQLRDLTRGTNSSDESKQTDGTTQPVGQSSPATPSSDTEVPFEDGPVESPEQLQAVLQQMDPYDFEHFVADLWAKMGWQTEVSSEAADQGVDVVATKTTPYDQTTLIQAKRYGPNTTVGSPEIQQYASLKNQYDGVDKVVVVTTNEFTAQGRELAQRLNVKLVDGSDLVDLLGENEAAELVAEYLEFVSLNDDKSATREASKAHTDRSEPRANPGHEHPTARASPSPSFVPETRWRTVIGAATLGWIVSVVFLNVLPAGIGGLLVLGSWVALPIALYQDSKALSPHTDWPTYTWLYVLVSLFWIVAIVPGVVYLWRRRKLEQREDAISTD